MKEYDFIVKSRLSGTMVVEAESAEEARRIAEEEISYYPKNATVEEIAVFED